MTEQLPSSAPAAAPAGPNRSTLEQPVDPNEALSEYWIPPSVDPPFGPPLELSDASSAAGPPKAPTRRRWRFGPRTLTSRLVGGVAGLVILVVVASGFATYAALGSFLTDRLDQQIDSTVLAYQRSLPECIAQGGCEFGVGPAGSFSAARSLQPSWFAIIDVTGAQLPITSNSQDTIPAELTASQRSSLVTGPGGHRSLTIDGRSVRVTVRQVNTTAGFYYEVVGLSTDDVTNTLRHLLLIELIIGASAVLVAFLATAFGVRLSLRPLHRVTNTARAVTAELSPEGAGLDRRVPVKESESDTEVGRLAESVNTLLGAVETQFAARVESDQRMRQFMADASHELRTPLTSIRGYAELARMRRQLANASADPEADRSADTSGDSDALERIETEGTRMSRLVEDLLTLARGDVGAPNQSAPVDVGELLDDAVEGAQAAYPSRHFTATTYSPMTVHGDHDELLRVIRNLLTNAAVHTAPGGPIRVTANREGQHAAIRVIDSGPGLTPEQTAHVFERFWRSDASRARSSGGTGLGLSIVASIVAAHGGTVRFDSTVETGSVVTVTLPVQ